MRSASAVRLPHGHTLNIPRIVSLHIGPACLCMETDIGTQSSLVCNSVDASANKGSRFPSKCVGPTSGFQVAKGSRSCCSVPLHAPVPLSVV